MPHQPELASPLSVEERIRYALLEDLYPNGDVTSQALVPEHRPARAEIRAKDNGVLSGTTVLKSVFEQSSIFIDGSNAQVPVQVEVHLPDGAPLKRGDVVATISASARTLLVGERTALNLICRFSGISSQTAQYVSKISHTKARLLDTRKTLPLWRDFDKQAVAHGGGLNHRYNLSDMILIKDNHLALWGSDDPAGAVNAAQAQFPAIPVEVEVVDMAGLQNVCQRSKPQYVLLDNFNILQLRNAVEWCDIFFVLEKNKSSRPLLEASGGISLETLAGIAETGVDRISVGALTHSVKVFDMSLEIIF
jgi:nicotinate-nucleotide pyrophosphorylase (carboxylating)